MGSHYRSKSGVVDYLGWFTMEETFKAATGALAQSRIGRLFAEYCWAPTIKLGVACGLDEAVVAFIGIVVWSFIIHGAFFWLVDLWDARLKENLGFPPDPDSPLEKLRDRRQRLLVLFSRWGEKLGWWFILRR